MIGKLHPKLLERYVFTRIGIRDPAVIAGPGISEDAAIIDLGDGRVLVAHADPITDVEKVERSYMESYAKVLESYGLRVYIYT